MVLFTDLPNDIINNIISQFTIENTDKGLRKYIKIEYFHNKIIYFEYTGDMKDGYPNGYGQMYSTTRIVNNTFVNIGSYLETDWIYLPFLLVSKHIKPRLIARFN